MTRIAYSHVVPPGVVTHPETLGMVGWLGIVAATLDRGLPEPGVDVRLTWHAAPLYLLPKAPHTGLPMLVTLATAFRAERSPGEMSPVWRDADAWHVRWEADVPDPAVAMPDPRSRT